MKIGTLTVISNPFKMKFGITKYQTRYVVTCKCECGHEDMYVESSLVMGLKCKICFTKDGRKLERKGNVFGFFTCISDPYYINDLYIPTQKRRVIDVKCQCGNIKTLQTYLVGTFQHLTCGHCKYTTQARSNGRTKHGGSHTRLYRIWQGMRDRCYNVNTPIYQYYGNRGIKICDEWNDFETFRSWALSNGYKDNLTIERIDPKQNYMANNCEWITNKENSRRRNAYYPQKILELEKEIEKLKYELKYYKCNEICNIITTS